MQTVCIVGLGFVGEHLVDSFAQSNLYNVYGFDISPKRIEYMKKNYINCVFTSNENDLVNCDLFCISVPTLLNAEKNDIDSGPILKVKEMIDRVAKKNSIVVIESSVYVGATRKLFSSLLANDIYVGFSPERVDPGRITPPHTEIPKVVSGLNDSSLDKIVDFYSKVFKYVMPVSSTECAEMCKLYENCFRMVNIAYVNEISDLCKTYNIDPYEMINASKTKPFGFMAFYPGLGVGGHCIPVNPYYLAKGDFSKLPILHRSVQLMEKRPRVKSNEIIDNSTKQNILVIGLAFKPGETLTTNSPSIDMVKELLNNGHKVKIYDPLVYKSNKNLDVFNKDQNLFSFWNFFNKKQYVGWLSETDFTKNEMDKFDKIIITIKQHNINWSVLKDIDEAKIYSFIDKMTIF